ncbi:hypothetical protein OSSY52_01520 [Tepiditoga spiralis]|uniref:Uncharacterized protein n=1 Tax=Tepiditoga spiralis TaxID=2108365 RepID=A0A7G1G185_9BACT|nr:hypothetical protein [Tepiditoga spiralis]BBE30011.1 hypothetical protein OSSY52_01520 [Tepiditoga spiralis]
MKGTFNKNISYLIKSKNLDIKEIAKELKISMYSFQKILNEDYTGYSRTSLKDISKRLEEILDEKITFIEKKESIVEDKTVNKKAVIYLIFLWFLIFLNGIFLFLVSKDALLYSKIRNGKTFDVYIKNLSKKDIKLNNKLLSSEKSLLVKLSVDDKIKVENNNGIVELKTPFEVYRIKLENFEVVLSGKVKKK